MPIPDRRHGWSRYRAAIPRMPPPSEQPLTCLENCPKRENVPFLFHKLLLDCYFPFGFHCSFLFLLYQAFFHFFLNHQKVSNRGSFNENHRLIAPLEVELLCPLWVFPSAFGRRCRFRVTARLGLGAGPRDFGPLGGGSQPWQHEAPKANVGISR